MGQCELMYTFERLLALGAIPIVNENDTVSTEEIEFGDNDTLSAIVARLVKAGLLILLSDIDGLYDGLLAKTRRRASFPTSVRSRRPFWPPRAAAVHGRAHA